MGFGAEVIKILLDPDYLGHIEAKSAKIFKKAYDDARQDPKYRVLYKAWRKQENEMS